MILRATILHPDGQRDVYRALAHAALGRGQYELRARLGDALTRASGPRARCGCPGLRARHEGAGAGHDRENELPAIEWWLWQLRDGGGNRDKKQLTALLALPVFRDAAGAPRLSLSAALCGLHPGRPLHALVRHLGERTVVDALCARPEQWDAVCRLPPETPSEALRLLAVIAPRDPLIWQRLVAIALVRWSSGQKDACDSLLHSVHDGELGTVVEAFINHLKEVDEKSAAKAIPSLGGLLQARTAGRDADAVFARLLTLAGPEASPASELLLALLRPMQEADVVRVVQGLSSVLQLRLVGLCDSVFQLPWAHELAMARVLRDAENQHVRRWAARLIEAPMPSRPRLVPPSPPCTRSPTARRRGLRPARRPIWRRRWRWSSNGQAAGCARPC